MTTKPGDRIRIVHLGMGDPTLKPGDEYIVEWVDPRDDLISLEGTNVPLVASLGDDWELVEDAVQPMNNILAQEAIDHRNGPCHPDCFYGYPTS